MDERDPFCISNTQLTDLLCALLFTFESTFVHFCAVHGRARPLLNQRTLSSSWSSPAPLNRNSAPSSAPRDVVHWRTAPV